MEERRVAGDVLLDAPECTGRHRAWGGSAEDLGAADPDGSDPVVLEISGKNGELENDAGPGEGALSRQGIVGRRGRGAEGVGKVLLEDKHGAPRGLAC